MVHTRNGSSYSVQPDGPSKRRGKTRTRSAKYSTRKTNLEDSRAAPHSPRSVPTSFDVNSEPELIEGSILRDELFPSGSHRNMSVQIQKLVQRSKRRGVGNMLKPLEGGHELLLTHQELSGSGEDHRTLRRVEPIVLQRQGKKDKELAEEPKSFICRPEAIGNDPSFARRSSGVYQLQKHPKRIPKDLRRRRKVPRAIRERVKAKKIVTDLTHKGTGSPNWSLQYGQDSYGIHNQRLGKGEQEFSMQIID
ncbi:hypothetical protein O181_062708 [Austropuccinia psidii MF-1]|uniref:Uncharacterized protein n=1 Tax=Austropuccinia psidii MF-1 TaxID=1389203 RepID=A0A9Q3EK48_9BASI|nr:hypothetical protein [Austropuccinia psidii MF-1]